MGLAVNGNLLPTHMLLPEAVVIKLAMPRRQRLKAERLIAKITSWNLMLALRDNQLEIFYADLLMEISSDISICPHMTLLQRQVTVIQCLRDWLIAVESAISDFQHSDMKGNKKFLISEHRREHAFSLRKISKLRTFLYRQLEVPDHAPRPQKPNYEGSVNTNVKSK